MTRRLAVLEAALRVQAATGVSHLQQLETNPAAHGLPAEARPAVRRLRRQRNQALHDHGRPFTATPPTTSLTTADEATETDGVPIPAAHLLGPGQVPKRPPPATSRTAGVRQAALGGFRLCNGMCCFL